MVSMVKVIKLDKLSDLALIVTEVIWLYLLLGVCWTLGPLFLGRSFQHPCLHFDWCQALPDSARPATTGYAPPLHAGGLFHPPPYSLAPSYLYRFLSDLLGSADPSC